LTSDAFRHLPALRGKLTPAEQSTLRASLEVVTAWDERARNVGMPAGWRLSDQELEGTRRALLGEWCAEQPSPGFDGILLSSVDTPKARFDVVDVFARTTCSIGVAGLALQRRERRFMGPG